MRTEASPFPEESIFLGVNSESRFESSDSKQDIGIVDSRFQAGRQPNDPRFKIIQVSKSRLYFIQYYQNLNGSRNAPPQGRFVTRPYNKSWNFFRAPLCPD